MTDATPGVIIFVVGIFFVWMTRFKVRQITEHPEKGSVVVDGKPVPETDPQSAPSSPSSGRTVFDYHANHKF